MSKNAFKRFGFCTIDDNPVNGVIEPVTASSYSTIKQRLQLILSEFSTVSYWTAGSSGTWDPGHPCYSKGSLVTQANDIDIWLDVDNVGQCLDVNPISVSHVKQAVLDILSPYYTVCQSGNIVHVALPANYDVYSFEQGKNIHAYYQIDLVFASDAANIVKHHEHDLSQTIYPGYNRIAAISSLVNSVPGYPERTFQYSAFTGLVKNRNSGKTVTETFDQLATLALGEKYSSSDLRNLSTIVKIVGLNSNRLAQYREEFALNGK